MLNTFRVWLFRRVSHAYTLIREGHHHFTFRNPKQYINRFTTTDEEEEDEKIVL